MDVWAHYMHLLFIHKHDALDYIKGLPMKVYYSYYRVPHLPLALQAQTHAHSQTYIYLLTPVRRSNTLNYFIQIKNYIVCLAMHCDLLPDILS